MILDGISTFMRNRYIMHQVDVSALANFLCKQMDNKTFAVGFIDSVCNVIYYPVSLVSLVEWKKTMKKDLQYLPY